ncbi:hypothetical protein KDE12_03390 [Campylobacter sp. faydin G-105]|uniref:hypothetical protein n=1 Tax=Campylobacter anatolicus TaxID=2829105 RepID=UPI001B9A82CC|nr:hypothetical protein [Campylobacter anatolicus]MBR8461895.1 hypothetical protein [Campylobacter anatolicus]
MNKKLDSGSRHAMQKAKEYGIKRAVMYDRNLSYTQEFNLNTELIEEEKQNLRILKISDINRTSRNFKIFDDTNTKKLVYAFVKFLRY